MSDIHKVRLLGHDLSQIDRVYRSLGDWLSTAFDLWSTIGLDQVSGGFVERLSPAGEPIEELQRVRVVGRQIYAFSLAPCLGWRGPAEAVVQRGLAYLNAHCWTAEGFVASTIERDGRIHGATFDLYDHAFVLFGLAAAAAALPDQRDVITAQAKALLRRMSAAFAHPLAGFREPAPQGAPQLANPHMHMLEAALAWDAVAPDPEWARLADAIAQLCLSRMLDPQTGALLEFFGPDWQRLEGSSQALLEPGHQFEWAWLLVRWGSARKRADAIAAARRLVEIGEGPGVDRGRRLAINGLQTNLVAKDRLARLWPQTERIKGHLAIATLGEADSQQAIDRAAEAAAGLIHYTRHPVAGAWWEHIGEDGQPLLEPSRASSLYHIVCAMNELRLFIDGV